MRTKHWDVIIVGGGPAGITAALRLARSDLDVLVVEAAIYPGAENWSGAVYFAEELADPNVLGADELARAPYERRVVKRGFFSCNGFTIAGIQYRNPETFRHCFTVLRPVYDRYLAERARQLGVTLLTETTVDGLIREADRVVGVHTDRGPLYGRVVFLAEGDAAHLVSKEGFERDRVRSKSNGQPAFLQGVKEVIQLEPDLIDSRFKVESGQAACYEVLLRNGTIDGRPVRLNMAGFIYTNRSSVSIGLVLPLENLTSIRGGYNRLMEWYKGLPPIRRLIEGGTSTSYGAKIIRGGGLRELPRLVADGVAVGGAATGIGVDFPYPNFTGPACAMGRMFAEAVLALHEKDEEPTVERLEELYVEPLKASNYYKDVEHLGDWPAFVEHTEALFDRQIDLLNGSLYTMTRPGLAAWRKWTYVIRMVSETLSGRWRATLSDLAGGARALGIPGFILKHLPVALLMSIPNTILALLPFTWGKADGDIDFTFSVEGETTGRLPWYKRWLGARFRSALARAAGVLYANDGVPVGRKLDRCVGIVMRRFSLWEVLGAIVGVVGYLLTRVVQRAGDMIRFSARKASLEELQNTFHGRWSAAWQRYTDLSEGSVGVEKGHDAKLGEISYASEQGSHIKVFFPPAGPDGLADPSASALWGVCPAAVYQINLDRTMHASVAVNFENCVKCETCWRIEPLHVDWTRFGKHRLIYEVYTEADDALLRLLSERALRPSPEVEPSYWPATLDGDPSASESSPPEALAEAIHAARQAIELAAAKCDELNRDVWHGPRVLEPGQVDWYAATIEYFACLAQEAASAVLAEPIDDWLSDQEMQPLHVELLQLTKDLGVISEGLRSQAAARRFFAAEADARQIRDHHLVGLSAALDRIAEHSGISDDHAGRMAQARSTEIMAAPRKAARAALREHLAQLFDRQAIRRLEHAGSLHEDEIALLKAAVRAALGGASAEGLDAWKELEREDIIAELARVDPSLAFIASGHLAAVAALELADAPESTFIPLRSVERFVTVALEEDAAPADAGWHGRLPFVASALAEGFVARGGDRLAFFDRDTSGVRVEKTPAIGLTGAGIAEITLEGARPSWSGGWNESRESSLFACRARDVAALALGAGALLVERAVDHARNRIQFPDMFQDLDGRDAVGKFGAVRAHVAHLEAARLALETTLLDADWRGDHELDPLLAKVLVTDLFGPDLPSINYRAGQVIGGTAFSEDDIFSKFYRDSSVFPHYIRQNARLNGLIGARLSKVNGSLLAIMAPKLKSALERMERRPILDLEASRLRQADEILATALRRALDRDAGRVANEVTFDIVGELATRLYAWALLLMRAHRRLEGALPAERWVEAAQLWADTLEERMIEIDDELETAGRRAELGGYVFQLGDYPDEPIATGGLDFDYRRDVVEAERGYRSGSFLLEPPRLDATRYVPELMWADGTLRSHYEEYLRLFRRRFVEGDYDPSFERYIERLHYIPREDIDWTRERGFFRVVIPEEYGGQGRWKADYYNLCMVSKRLADVSHTLTIQANTSIGTTPMLLGLYQDLAAAEKELRGALENREAVAEIAGRVRAILEMMSRPDIRELESAFAAVNKDAGARLARGRILKKVVFDRFLSHMRRAGAAGMKRDLDGFKTGLEKALSALEGWEDRVQAQLDEIPDRRFAHEFFLRLISARMISAFALTEPSAGSDTARIRTEARLDSRHVHTDEDGVKYFFLDEENEESRRNIADMRRFEFDYESSTTLYRYSDDAEPAEVISQEYTYEEGEEKYRYLMIGDRRVDIHDMALIRPRNGREEYEFYVLNGAKMWITNGHIAGVEALYARTPAGVTGFMVDALTEGFIVGKDEEKTGQRGSPTNEITLTNVRVPRECVIGIEGRGQENALETLNVGRTGLCISSAAGMQSAITDVRDYVATLPHSAEPWTHYRLGLALEEMFATESLAYDLIGLFDDKTSDALRMESSVGKLFGTDGLHRVIHYLEPLYGIDGQTQRYLIEKDRRDARVMTIYEGTNEIQQFLLLKDLVDMIGPHIEDMEAAPQVHVGDSSYGDEAATLDTMLTALHERLKVTRERYKSAAWQRALFQPIFFRLARMVALIKVTNVVLHRGHWIASSLDADDAALHRDWCDLAARSMIARARREFWRLARGFDRDLETLQAGGRTAELKLAETVFDEADAAHEDSYEERGARIERTPLAGRLAIAVVAELAPRLAPHPRVQNGRIAEHVHAFTDADRHALQLALGLKRAAPDRIAVTLLCAAPLHAEDQVRFGLAAGADSALLLNTEGEWYTEPALARALADALRGADGGFDLVLVGASSQGPTEGRLALRLAEELRAAWAPEVLDLWVRDAKALCASGRFPCTLEIPLPAVAGVAPVDIETGWQFSTAQFVEALHKALRVIPFPADAERSDEELAAAGVAAAAREGEEAGSVEPERAAAVLIEVGDLGNGATAAGGAPYGGAIRSAEVSDIDWGGVVFIPELADDGELARSARGPLEAARGIADRASLTLHALVLSEPLDDNSRRALVGQLVAIAPFARITVAESEALASGSPYAYGEALARLLGPGVASRPAYVLTTPWLAEALPRLARALREADVHAEELPGISRVEFRDGDGVDFVRPVHQRKLRAHRVRPAAGNGMRILWCEPEVTGMVEGAGSKGGEPEVGRVRLDLDYDPQTDALARALDAARQQLGVITLENAEFIIDVGAGLGSVDNLETVVEPLKRALQELGAPHVVIGATRKVTMDLSWLPDEHQIGQTGVRVNPRVMIALGVSGAPQHIDYVGDRAVIFAFNLDPQAPLMTLNQRRDTPKVYPVVGNLLSTVPKFVEALRTGRGRR